MKYVLFTDNLADMKIEQVCREVKRRGFDGLDLTLRPGGHVLPKDAEMGLSHAHQVALREKIEIYLFLAVEILCLLLFIDFLFIGWYVK